MTNTQDAVLAQAEADLERAEAAIERATKDRDEILAFIRRHKMYAPMPRPSERSLRDLTMAQAIEAVLRASNAPMSVPDIVEALETGGKRFSSGNPAAHVSTTLSRNDQFSFERGVGWSLAEG